VRDHDRKKESKETPCDLLHRHLADPAQEVIFGSVTAPSSLEAASGVAAMRRVPYLSVFVVSSNPEQEVEIQYLFKDIPAKLVRLRNADFFSAEEGLYPTMGVDRAAGLYGAKSTYGCPVLLLDGGTAMTYTALDSDSTIIGGGISLGIKLRFQALSDNCGKLPVIDHHQFKTAVTDAMERHEPLPFFAKDTENAMMTTVCSELACQLRNIVKQFVAIVRPDKVTWANVPHACLSHPKSATIPSDGCIGTVEHPTTVTAAGEVASEQVHTISKNARALIPIVVTGGDAKLICDLLKEDASHIVQIEPGVVPMPRVDVHFQKNIIHYGVGSLLEQKCNDKKTLHAGWMYESMIQGLRVVCAEPKSGSFDEADIQLKRGSIVSIEQSGSVDEFMFLVRFDSGETENWNLIKLFGKFFEFLHRKSQLVWC
jgi:pantothenate kinase type III